MVTAMWPGPGEALHDCTADLATALKLCWAASGWKGLATGAGRATGAGASTGAVSDGAGRTSALPVGAGGSDCDVLTGTGTTAVDRTDTTAFDVRTGAPVGSFGMK